MCPDPYLKLSVPLSLVGSILRGKVMGQAGSHLPLLCGYGIAVKSRVLTQLKSSSCSGQPAPPLHTAPSAQLSTLLLDRLISSSPTPRVCACDFPLPGVSFLVSSSHAWHPPIPQSNLNVTSSERLSLAICIPQDLTGIHGTLIQMI